MNDWSAESISFEELSIKLLHMINAGELRQNDVLSSNFPFLRLHSMGKRLGCRIEAKCPHVGSGPTEVVPSLGVFLRDRIQYLRGLFIKPQNINVFKFLKYPVKKKKKTYVD